ncbi:MAG: AbrB/MazE/SpoVT family DNA-binding domain-containing protein, partial [Candidatus Limnocylindrales bacterium]
RVKQTRRRKGFTRISRKNQVTIPVDALAIAGVGPGDTLMVEARPTGEIVLRRQEDPLERYIGSMTGMFPPNYLRDLRDEWE